ncbi:MAG TPA: helix-turn-helix transcriptional regulator [Pyrinomonadaceae bacterium]|jgi:transcriptional regulator with XRE-family HTH domain
MGKNARPKPMRLAEKLLAIRNALGLSQMEMLRRLEAEDQIDYTAISKYELGRNEPSLMLLLQYARVAGIHMEDLVDDELDLPDKLPGPVKYTGLKRASFTRSKKR